MCGVDVFVEVPKFLCRYSVSLPFKSFWWRHRRS